MLKLIYFIDDTINFVVRIIFILIMLLGIYYMYDSWYIYQHANDSSFLKYRPQKGKDTPELKELSEDAIAWITIDGTNLDYPIMQGDTNDKYLNLDPYGNFSLSGSIFLDSRNNPDFKDRYSLVYGHHMDHGYVFGCLDNFLKEDYLKAHTEGTLYTASGIQYNFHVFAATTTEASNDAVFGVTESEGTAEFLKTECSIFVQPNNPDWENHIVGLSTCKTPDSIERTCVFGYLEKEGQGQKMDLNELGGSDGTEEENSQNS